MSIPSSELLTLDAFRAMLGKEMGVSEWTTITQDQIDTFAECTDDHQFIHVDPEAAAKTPFGGTIAHGFLTLSMLSSMAYQMPSIEGTAMAVNYGFNKLRFVSPVRSGARIRGRFVLKAFEEIRPGEIQTTTTVSVEIEGEDKPALVADWLGRRYLEKTE
ncbi:MaoC family dehydratase [Thalassovita sp.]|jgi:acyl dehydratase|uniref:MaoC family dehydratase n=1 Tax=Thalassovita sp. TaxID=1979401 RepID=UPI003B5B1851